MSKNQTPQQNDDEQLSANEQQILEEIRGDVVDVAYTHVEDYGRDDNPAVGILRKHASEGDKRPQQSLRELGISPQTNAEAAASGGDSSMAGHVFATNADEDVREVRLVDDPEKGEHVELFDPRDAGSDTVTHLPPSESKSFGHNVQPDGLRGDPVSADVIPRPYVEEGESA